MTESSVSGSGLLADLSEDIDSIYKLYTQPGLPHVRITLRLSQLDVTQAQSRLAPDLPHLLVVLLDDDPEGIMPPIRPQANTNSLLNVLVDTPQPLDLDLPPTLAQHWRDEGAAVREVNEGNQVKVIKRDVGDFKFIKNIGEGLYSTVMLATDKHTNRQYAVKVLDKRHIIKEKKVKYLNIEKHALNRLSNRMGIISLYFTFQDKNLLYFVLDFAANGELLSLINKYGTLNEDSVRHFGAQILSAIQYMHDNGVIHRDIKPENILLDEKLRIQITDFGTARLLEKKDDDPENYPLDVRAKLFVGTAEYVLPELLELKYCGKPGDIWAYGCILYQMIAGKPPFKATNEYLTFQKITKLQYAFTAGFPVVLRDLIKHILVLLPQKRFTIDQIQQHYFFLPTNWDDFDLIWYADPPELGPFKMLAKGMLNVPPELTKAYSLPVVTTRKVYGPNQKRKQTLLPSPIATNNLQVLLEQQDSHGSLGTPVPPTAPTKPVNPAKAAAYVLNRGSDEKLDRPLALKVKLGPQYIPGTNILRPQINPRTSFPIRKPKQPPTLALAMSTLAQQQSTASPTLPRPERVPQTPPASAPALAPPVPSPAPSVPALAPPVPTPATIRKPLAGAVAGSGTPTSLMVGLGISTLRSNLIEVTPPLLVEAAWKKYLEHPDERILRLGPAIVHREPTEVFERKHRGQIHNAPISLSNKVDQANRSVSNKSLLLKVVNGLSNGLRGTDVMDTTTYQGNDGEGDEAQAIIDHWETVKEEDEEADKKKLLFKKFLHSATQNADEVLGTAVNHPLERPRTCTVVCTTHGRVLIFSRNNNDNYRMIMEVKLNYSFMRIKEVVLALKFKLLIPTVGTFALMLNVTTFVFEVEKYEVGMWTEALAQGKLNEFERHRLGLASEPVPRISETAETPTLPRLPTLDNFEFLPQLPSSATRKKGMMPVRIRRLIKRKPPPAKSPLPPGEMGSPIDMSTGFQSHSVDAELRAAQLAAAAGERNRSSIEYPHRLSFSKENGSNTVSRLGLNLNKTPVTQKTSKFLARSLRRN